MSVPSIHAHLSAIYLIRIPFFHYSAAAFLFQLPSKPAARPLAQRQRWSIHTAAHGDGEGAVAEADGGSDHNMLPRRQRRTSRHTSDIRDEATRNEALRRVGLVGLGAMMLGVRPVEALQGGTGGE